MQAGRQAGTFTTPSPLWQTELLHCSLLPSSATGAQEGWFYSLSPEFQGQGQRQSALSVEKVRPSAGLATSGHQHRKYSVSVLAVACPSVSIVLLFCCVLASAHSDQRLLHPKKQERPASQNSCPFFHLYLFIPYTSTILLADQILYCSFQNRDIPVPYKHLLFCPINKTINNQTLS